MIDLGTYQNKIQDLGDLNNLRYENIFKIYTNENNQYVYNILNTISFNDFVEDSYFTSTVVSEKTPWTVLSFNAYGTIDLWWLIALTNGIRNPFELPSNNIIKILKPQYVKLVLTQISNQLV